MKRIVGISLAWVLAVGAFSIGACAHKHHVEKSGMKSSSAPMSASGPASRPASGPTSRRY